MLKKIFIILILSISILFSLTTIKLNKNDKIKNNIFSNINLNNSIDIKLTKGIKQQEREKDKTDNEIIGKIIIKKLNIANNLYKMESKKNNVNENVTILENSITPDKEDSIMFIAAHSGTGKLAFFKDLDKLKEGDSITLIYKDQNYDYIVKDYWEENKNGYINVVKEDKKQLILTTCSPTKEDKQLIINATEK